MILDLVIVLILFYGFYSGYSKGIVATLFSIFSLLIGILAAMKLSDFAIDGIQAAFNINPVIALVLGFAITFIIVIALIRFAGRKLEQLLKFANLNFINKILGGVALTAILAIILAYGYKGLDNLDRITDEQKENSFTYPLLKPLPEATKPITSLFTPLVQNFWEKAGEAMDTLKQKGDDLKEG